jgi:ABC-type cobalamin/Fe3+-siderophores transport system ATPase subunit
MNNNNQRGSEWRKWDLHVHSPASHGYVGDWEQFETQLKNAECDVIGINDYFSVAGYKYIKEKIAKEELDIGNKKILPVVEFRMTESVQNRNTTTNGVTHFNFHILFDDSIEISDIENLIKGLKSNGTKISSDYDDKNKLSSKKISLDSLLSDLNQDEKFKDKFLLWLPYDEYGGIDEIDPDSDGWIKENFIKKANILGSSHKKQINFFLWKSDLKTDGSVKFTQEQFKSWFISKKACIKGSDSHSHDYPIGKLKDKDSNPIEKFCWIKAEPTFEGLKQVEFDPDDRVKVQEANPYSDNTKYTIDSLTITQSNAITKQIVPFNRDLITIIGGKGSGKSLLLSIIAAMNNKYAPHDAIAHSDTIIDYAFFDKTGTLQQFNSVDISTQTEQNEPIFYVKQEELAEKSKNKEAVRATYLKEIGIYDQAANYQPISDLVDRLLGQIDNFEASIESLKDKTKYYEENSGGQITFKTFLDKKISNLKKTIEKTSSAETKELIAKISLTIRSGRDLKLWIENPGISEIINDLVTINDKITTFNNRLATLKIDSSFSLINQQKIEDEFAIIEKEVTEKHKLLQSDYLTQQAELKKNEINEDIPVLLKTLEGIQNELALYENANSELEITEQQIQERKKDTQNLFKDGENDGIFFAISQEVSKINRTYTMFSDERKDSPIFQLLFSGVSIEAKIFFNQKKLIEDLSQCFLKGKAGNIIKTIFGDKSNTYENYFAWIRNGFWDFYKKARDNNDLMTRIPGIQLTGAERMLDIIFKKWFEYISVSTAIENDFDGEKKEIEKMSTGELATILLKLKLVTEGLDKQIILLDQPEDHLDNSFIANGLVDLLKKLKKERQVIIATHNANLVVGTDAEQVIIAHGVTNAYTYGGIENPQIKEGIINILEGGAEAFKKRMIRYK